MVNEYYFYTFSCFSHKNYATFEPSEQIFNVLNMTNYKFTYGLRGLFGESFQYAYAGSTV